MEWLWWVGGALVLGLIEILSLDFVFLMFAGGALAAAGVSAADQPLWVQVMTFAVASLILLLVLRPWIVRKAHVPALATNTDAHVGRTAAVVQDVTTTSGLIKLVGEVWSARAVDGSPVLPEGTTVRVVRIDGATAVVEQA
ncbi:NfeD family protein [Antribacter sp. KLBMP9083]|uniref:NfeD family protein n=1 Tax=Antribacter soli TaxID=2910976 RepID=A0AA41QER2_9MICO|nr:NfeD family protein [Antribacter soli]MCF4121460.1 NfeD family protein [Antribacter soli]